MKRILNTMKKVDHNVINNMVLIKNRFSDGMNSQNYLHFDVRFCMKNIKKYLNKIIIEQLYQQVAQKLW